MQVEFQSMNPSKTDDSFLLRVNDSLDPVTHCFLVDCGKGVDVDEFLDDTDELSGIIITHAHEDHISALPENARKNVPIYTTPDTAIVLKELFNHASNQSNFSGNKYSSNGSWSFWDRITPNVAETVTQQLTPIDETTQLTPSVDLIPLPAGHTIGAGSFIFKTYTGTKEHHFLATGDFTPYAVGQTPGLNRDVAQVADIDVLFMNTGMRTQEESYEDVFTDSIRTILEEATQGKKVLVTSSSLTSIHYANWLQKTIDEYSSNINVVLAGLSAVMYNKLGYDASNIELVPTYQDNSIVENGTIVISAPEVPASGGSGRIYKHLENDANASIIQIKSGGDVSNNQVSIDHSYRYVPHPTQDELDSFVEFTNPVHTVLNHGPKNHYKGKYSFTIHWTVMNHHKRNLLLDNGTLCNPPWVNYSYASEIKSENMTRDRMMVAPTGPTAAKPLTDPDLTFEDVRLNVNKISQLLSPTRTKPGSDSKQPTENIVQDGTQTIEQCSGETLSTLLVSETNTDDNESNPDSLNQPTEATEVVAESPDSEQETFEEVVEHLEKAQQLLETNRVNGVIKEMHSDGMLTIQLTEETVTTFNENDEITILNTPSKK